ncbi:Saccharopine dehydrogenase [NADP(+), L-glutamate-forming] [Trapelia coarctata]|nr:Saccharopine dehydrogenase [NADP(+), L-glutamate-forming] [Trapelia coarctata]
MALQRVLMLGSGFVTRPTLDILSDAGIEVSVACRTLDSAKKLSEGVKLAKPISLDVTDDNLRQQGYSSANDFQDQQSIDEGVEGEVWYRV